MLGRKLPTYKTKLCILYQRGRCPRENCSFAHGDAELRRFAHGGGGGSFNGRREYRTGDLRDKLERRHSPRRRYSPARDARNHHAFHGHKSVSHDRDNSLSRSPVRRNERRHRKKQHMDGESDDSENFRMSDGTEDAKRERKVSSYDEKDLHEEQLKQVQLDIEKLEDDKSRLENFLEAKVDEAHKLSNRIEDLEIQLNKEQEDCKRITSKVKKFIRAYGRYVKAQDELKRSQARLQRVGEQLGSDISKPGANEEDSSVNIVSDGEPDGDYRRSPRNDEHKNDASVKKRPRGYPTTSEEVRTVNLQKRGRFSGMITKSEKLIRSDGPACQLENDRKETEAVTEVQYRANSYKSATDDYKYKRGKVNHASIVTLDKAKGSERGQSLPSTSMAAHAVDELIEMEEKFDALDATTVIENGVADGRVNSSYIPPLPPPVNQNAYKEYEADDEDVDVEKVDTEMLDIDLNSEVDIEQ